MPEARSPVRTLLRGAVNALATLLTAPCWVPARLQAALGGGEGWFVASAQLLSLAPGRTGILLRRGFYRMCLEACADDCGIDFGTTLAHRRARIGRGVYIGGRCTIGQVIIEDDVAIGSHVNILSGRHQHHFDDPVRPILEQGGTFHQVRIGRNSWIGNGAVVMADIGDGCIVGAGSVVVKPIPVWTIAVGNPARAIRSRGPAQPHPGLSVDGVGMR